MPIIRDSFVMLTWRVAAIAIGVLTTVLLARWLGPQDRGELAILVLSLALVTLVLQFGVPEALIYVLGARRYHESEIVSSALVYSLLVSAVAAVVALGAMHALTDMDGATTVGLVIAGFLSVQATFGRHVLLGYRRFGAYSISIVAESMAYLAGIYGAWAGGGLTVSRAVEAYAVSLGVGTIFAWWLVSVRAGARVSLGAFHGPVIIECVSRGVHLFLTGIGSFGVQRLSYFLLEVYSGARAVGLYAAAATVPSLFANLPQQVATVLYSHTAATRAEEGRADIVAAVLQIMLFSGVVVLLPIVVFSEDIVRLLFGSEFAGIGNAMVVLSLAMGCAGLAGVVFNALAGSGMHRYGSYLTGLTLFAVAGLGWLWIPVHGLEGAAAAHLVAAGLGFTFILMAYCRAERVTLATFLKVSPGVWRALIARAPSEGSPR
jgi:O-antigen/teichoic acid export membrane protein